MATPVTFNAVSYSIPAFGDVGYAQGPGNLSSYLIAIASGTLQPIGGLFSLTSDANFGPNFGLVSTYYKTTTVNIATAGQFRLAKTDTIDWRNNANTLNLPLGINGSDQLSYNGVAVATSATASGFVNSGLAGYLALYPALGNTVDDVILMNGQVVRVGIVGQPARTTALEYDFPNPGNAVVNATIALLELAQTFTAIQTFAAATFTGLITGVNATLSGLLTLSATTNQLVLGTTNTVTITSPAPAASRVYTIPDVLGAASFVMNAGAQSIAGVKTFTGGAGAITLSGSTIAMGANKITGLANGTATTDAAAFGQIFTGFQALVQASTATNTATTSSTFTNTALTATITPTSASHRIRINMTGTGYVNAAAKSAYFTIARGGSNLATAAGFTAIVSAGGNITAPIAMQFIDSPATTSATTYTVQLKSVDNVTDVEFPAYGGTAVIILEEIV